MPLSHDLLKPLVTAHARQMKKELKVTLENFTYNLFDKVPIKFYYDKPPYDFKGYSTYSVGYAPNVLDLEVSTFSDLGGYWYVDDCQGTVWTIKIPREIMELVKADGSPYKRTKCGYWTVEHDDFELLANPFWIEIYEEEDKWKDLDEQELFNNLDEDEYEGWNVFKTIRAKVRKRISSRQ